MTAISATAAVRCVAVTAVDATVGDGDCHLVGDERRGGRHRQTTTAATAANGTVAVGNTAVTDATDRSAP